MDVIQKYSNTKGHHEIINDLCGIARHRSYSSFDDGWSRLEQLFLAIEFVQNVRTDTAASEGIAALYDMAQRTK